MEWRAGQQAGAAAILRRCHLHRRARWLNSAPNRLQETNMTRALLLILALTTLTACETIKGAARDVQNAGRVVENAL